MRGVAVAAVVGAVIVMVVELIVAAGQAGEKSERPKIFGIAQVEIASSNVAVTELFYGQVARLGGPCDWCESPPNFPILNFPSRQTLKISALGEKPPKNLVRSISFAVEDEKAMKRWLEASRLPFQEIYGPISSVPHAFDTLSVLDPEGHQLYFVRQRSRPGRRLPVIHAGWVVKDREKMDAFYRDVLGFHLYWQGGMKDDRTDWVSMQVPDGTDWIEYMLNIPADADKRLLGIMNHIALGVPDVHEVARQLEAKGMKLPEQPKIGRDGKWQLNLYDPDETRVEFMEFTPVEKPCCSEYMGPHPKP